MSLHWVQPTIKDIISRVKFCDAFNKVLIRRLRTGRCCTNTNSLTLDTFGSDSMKYLSIRIVVKTMVHGH